MGDDDSQRPGPGWRIAARLEDLTDEHAEFLAAALRPDPRTRKELVAEALRLLDLAQALPDEPAPVEPEGYAAEALHVLRGLERPRLTPQEYVRTHGLPAASVESLIEAEAVEVMREGTSDEELVAEAERWLVLPADNPVMKVLRKRAYEVGLIDARRRSTDLLLSAVHPHLSEADRQARVEGLDADGLLSLFEELLDEVRARQD